MRGIGMESAWNRHGISISRRVVRLSPLCPVLPSPQQAPNPAERIGGLVAAKLTREITSHDLHYVAHYNAARQHLSVQHLPRSASFGT